MSNVEFVSATVQHVRNLETEERLARDIEQFLGHEDPDLRGMIRATAVAVAWA